MFLSRLFRRKPKNLFLDGIGELAYFRDRTDEYWELVSNLRILASAVDIDFLAIAGNKDGLATSAKSQALKLISTPDDLWQLIDDEFVRLTQVDIPQFARQLAKDYFVVKSIAVEDTDSYEVGFHCKEPDIFLEVFVRNGTVSKIEKDYGRDE